MANTKIYRVENQIFLDIEGIDYREYFDSFDWYIQAGLVYIKETAPNHPREWKFTIAECLNEEGEQIGTLEDVEIYLSKLNKQLVDVVLQDPTSPLFVVPFTRLIDETILSVSSLLDDYTITIVDASNFNSGELVTIYSPDDNRVFFAKSLSKLGNVISLDTPLDFPFPAGSFVSTGSFALNVDGSVTPQIFGIRNPTVEDVPLSVDITRLMVKFLCNNSLDLSKFGDIVGGITNGIVLRRRGYTDDANRNVFNCKTNANLKQLMYDFEIEAALGNAQDGAHGRITFASQGKFGSVIRLKSNEDLQIVIQDDLTSLSTFEILAQGSEVVD